ncbi:type II toxin-antitoxin system HicB family antitoxin, partial [Acinetobacter nosocomialis]|uniref:type II toxin-antitoxin system HicB family antitoxin n=1 Tax=Acinetobacter nosocomialis TaxID=106654 RepID=UPI0030FAE117
HLEILAEDGQEIPLASELVKFVDDPEYKGMIWAVTEVDVSRYLGKPEKINVTLPSRLIRKIDVNVGKGKRYTTRSA